MIPAFFFFWCAYTLYALHRNLKGSDKPSLIAQALQFILLFFSLFWAAQTGVFSRLLWSPIDIGAGLLLGHALFALSLLITHQHAGDVGRHLLDVRGLCIFIGKAPELFIRFAGVSAIEELVYRVTAQGMLLRALASPPAAVLITAVAFAVLHGHFFRNGWVCAIEFLLFTLVIGVVYYYTSSLTLVVLAHLTRNLESAYLEFQLLMEEHKNATEALRILKQRHATVSMEPI